MPSIEEIQNLSETLHLKVDTDQSNSISVEEIIEYLRSEYEIQDFLLTYTNSTSHENAYRRFNERYQLALEAYKFYEKIEHHPELELGIKLSSIFSVKESYVSE